MKFLRWLAVGVWAMSTAACAEVRLGGKTIAESFADPRVVELTQAATQGNADTVARLVKAGVTVNAMGHEASTPLLWALYVNNLVGMEALLKAGADPNQKTAGGVSVLTWAAGGDKPAQLALLLRYGGNANADDTGKIEDRPLSRASAQGHLENVKMLLQAKADVNVHDEYGSSAAHKAVAQGNFDLVAYLLESGYTFDLQSLAKGVEMRQVPPDSDRQRWKDKVIEMLKARGVKFPAFIPCYPPGDARRKEENCKKSP